METPDATPAWASWALGTRVVVRRRLSPDEAEVSARTVTDVIGLLVEVTPAVLVLRPDGGRATGTEPLVTIDTDQVLAAKRVPPRRIIPRG